MTAYVDPGSGSILLGLMVLVVVGVVVGIVAIVKATQPKPTMLVPVCPACRTPLSGQPFCGTCGQPLSGKQPGGF